MGEGFTDTSILHDAFMSIFIALWAVITHYISILMAILSYFTRFTMKRGNARSWNSGWKRSKRWKPILHSSKSPETPRNIFLEFIRIIERKKYTRGPTPCPGDSPPYRARPYLLGPLVGLRRPSSAISSLLPWKKSWANSWDETPPPRGGTNLGLRQSCSAGETSLREGEIIAIVITNTPLIGREIGRASCRERV